MIKDEEKKYITCDIGDAIIYKGSEIPHGRDVFEAGDFSFHVQVFVHYVDANGIYAEEYKNDKRIAVGLKPVCGWPKIEGGELML